MRKLSTSLLKMALLVIVLWGCQEKEEVDNRPNILWLYVEDISPNLGCYGDENVQTPYVDEMAENGLLFTNMIMPAPVCSPTRSAIITGAMQTSLGIHNHHSSRTESSAIQLPDGVKTIPELFREQGYFTFNQGKDDYNFSYDRDSLYSGNYRNNGLYGFTGEKVDWSLKKDGQPYFGQIQLRGNKYIYAKDFKDQRLRTIDPDGLEIPPYYTQTDYMKQEWASYLEAIEITDKYVGEILGELEKKGLLDNTYVFFFSDHGMRL
ncbi:MAG: sulfatase-like hydrolase/transferase, partial [Bacteroidota bacterium]